MLTKGKILLLTTLCLLSLVSFGFASWTITETTPDQELLGGMHTDNIINSAEFIQLDTTLGDSANPGISCFKYQETGFLSEDGSYVTDTGYIYTYYVLDLEKCYNLFSSEFNSIVLTINLGYANNVESELNLFSNESSNLGTHSISSSFESDFNDLNYVLNELAFSRKKQYSLELKFYDVFNYYESLGIAEFKFYIRYTLEATQGTYFYNRIYQHLYKDMIDSVSFKVDIIVQGSN